MENGFIILILPDGYRHGNFQPQTVPLVVYSYNLALESLTWSVAVFPKESTIKPPFEIHRIGSFDSTCIVGGKGNPFTIDQDFSTGDCEEKSLIPAFREHYGFSCRDTVGNVGKKAVLFENSGRVD